MGYGMYLIGWDIAKRGLSHSHLAADHATAPQRFVPLLFYSRTLIRTPLTMHFFRDCGVSAVLESSGIT